MAVSAALLDSLLSSPPAQAWAIAFDHALEVCKAPVPSSAAASVIQQRDQALAPLDLFLATAGWDLWSSYEDSVLHTADALAEFWSSRPSGRAVLILDGLSLRELPWLLDGISRHGFIQHGLRATGAELPADTTSFARALGFGKRSNLTNDGAGSSHCLPGARTDCVDLPWLECIPLVGSEPDWVLWHEWPDVRLHDLAAPGGGLATLATEASQKLADDGFWSLVERLATGRRLVITSDHGYAASGFWDHAAPDQTEYLKTVFKNQRIVATNGGAGQSWVPPIDLTLQTRHGAYDFVLGRRRWKNAAGYPTLTHGGLSLLEVAVPFIEISRTQGA